MKHILIIIALLTTHATADKISQSWCMVFGKIAKGAMHARQHGVPIAETFRLLDASSSVLVPLGKTVAVDAYSRDTYITESIQNLIITEFQTEYTLKCLNGEIRLPRELTHPMGGLLYPITEDI